MFEKETIYRITKKEKGHFGHAVLVEFEAIITWCEEREEYYYFGYEPTNTMSQGTFGSAKLWKDKDPNFGVIKVISTGKTRYRARFSPVTPAHGPSYSNM